MTKLAASNFARRFIGIQGRESFIFVNFAAPEVQNQMNRPANPCWNVMLQGFCDMHAYQIHAACGRRIGRCGYTAVPKDGRTCFFPSRVPYENLWHKWHTIFFTGRMSFLSLKPTVSKHRGKLTALAWTAENLPLFLWFPWTPLGGALFPLCQVNVDIT